MKDGPLVTVMTPAYNAEKTIGKAISSLLVQDYTNWKCVIVNDGSTDGTKRILDKIDDPRFKILHLKENKGRPYARQVALDNAAGKYLAFLDADDFYHPEKLKKQINFLEANPDVRLVSCGMGSFDSNMSLSSVRGLGRKDIITYKFTGYYDAPHAPSMVRLTLAKNIKYDLSLKYGQDSDFFVRYLVEGKYFCIDEILYYYSEYESLSSKKILKTYQYNIGKSLKYIKWKPLPSFVNLIFNLMKYLIAMTALPLMGTKLFVKNRGRAPLQREIVAFREVSNRLETGDI